LDYSKGKGGLIIQWAALLENGHEVARDTHAGFTGTSSSRDTMNRDVMARDWNYFFDLPVFRQGAHYAIEASVTTEKGGGSSGLVFLGM